MNSKKAFTYLFVLKTVAGLSACYQVGGDITYEDVDIALTQYDKNYYSPGGYN
jgi:hypothetical protein